MSALVDRFVASSDMDKAMRMLVVQTIGFEVAASPAVAGHTVRLLRQPRQQNRRVRAIGYQTANPVQPNWTKVTQMVGVDYNDKPNWVMLLFAAKLTKSWQEQHGE